ncbi:fatty acid CoA ligase family protein [Propionivibrio sp.]|uniref:fatty acid CoA ligase family protein n=1 Tax=Propionivibrio sp. TaxID=2212460 RepID=UPI003BF40D53
MTDARYSGLCNIAAALPRMARLQPQTLAVVFPQGHDSDGSRAYARLTYQQLDEQSDAIARGLQAYGLTRGMRTVLMVKPSLEFFALTFALFKAGIVPVMIDPGLGVKQLKACLAEVEPEAFIGIPAAHAARILLGWGRSTIRHLVTVGTRWCWGGTTLARVSASGQGGGPFLEDTRADETAAILFTSGSTGIAKGVVYSHGNFMAQVDMIRETYAIQPGEIDLPTFPLFALFDPALGMTTIVPDMDFTRPAKVDPEKIRAAIDDWGVTNVFASPALLNAVARHGVTHGVHWPSVRRVLSAGAPVPAVTLERMQRMLSPEAEIFTPYGATEALPVASISSREILLNTRELTNRGAGVCVGRVVAPNDVRIIEITDTALTEWKHVREMPVGEVGEITVRGPTVTTAYFGRPEATRLAKIDRQGQTVHRMGDVGYFDAEGRLWFCGRKSHRLELADRTLFSAPVEEIFNTHAGVFRTALVGATIGGVLVPVVCIELDQEAPPGAVLTGQDFFESLKVMGAKFAPTRGISHFLIHPGFPVDIRHNAKIGREKLTVWAQGELS